MNSRNKNAAFQGMSRIGALAVALGIGAALVGAPAIASADTAKSDRTSSASSSSRQSSASKPAATSAARPNASSQQSSSAEAARKRAEMRKAMVTKPGPWVETDADNEFSLKRADGFYDDSKSWAYADDADIIAKNNRRR